MPLYLLQDLVGPVRVLEFQIQDGVDQVFVLQRAKAVLPAIPGEDGTVAKGRLAIEVKLCGPPGGCAILKFCPVGMKTRSATLRSKSGEVLDLQAPWFLQIVVISHDVRVLLRVATAR